MKRCLLFLALCLATAAHATTTITLKSTVTGKTLGTVTAKNTPYGLLLTPDLNSLPPGPHGFHVHTKPDCGEQGKSAGGHYDPRKTNKHRGPYDRRGHLGDLPVLYVDKDGRSTIPVLAPRLKERWIKRRALIIHAGGDNYSDTPKPLGGGGPRIACGVIK